MDMSSTEKMILEEGGDFVFNKRPPKRDPTQQEIKIQIYQNLDEPTYFIHIVITVFKVCHN